MGSKAKLRLCLAPKYMVHFSMIRALTVALAIFLVSGLAPAKTRKPKPVAFVQSGAPAYQFSFGSEADAKANSCRWPIRCEQKPEFPRFSGMKD